MRLYPICNHYINGACDSEILCWNSDDNRIYSSGDCFRTSLLLNECYRLQDAYYEVGRAFKRDVCIFLWSALPDHCKDPKRYFKASGDVLKYGFTREEYEEIERSQP